MAYAAPQLKLSTGKIINIPIFPYHRGTEKSNEHMVGGILYQTRENAGVVTTIRNPYFLNDNELLEFASLMAGATKTSIQHSGTPIFTGNCVKNVIAYWAEQGDGTYKLRSTGLSISGNPRVFPDYGLTTYSAATDVTPFMVIAPKFYHDYGYIKFDDQSVYEVSYQNYITPGQEVADPVNTYNVGTDNNSCDAYYSDNLETSVGGVSSELTFDTFYERVTTYAAEHDLDIQINVYDSEDPYSYEPATLGGGNGSMGRFNPDGVDPALIPALPSLSAANCGFISVYNPTSAQLKALSQFLWSSAFDIDSFKKLFSDPMECIIGLGVVPVRPNLGGSKNVTFGDVDSGVGMSYISSEYVEKNMGSVSIDLLYDSFMDYQTSIQIYLPYIGFRQLQPDDIIGGSISVTYHINVIDGGCTAYISHSTRGVLYQYSGSCIANVPLSAINYSGAIQNAVSAAINGAAVVAGIATGAAPVTMMGAAGLASNAANLALNSKPDVQRSGTVSGSAGLMGIQRPYVVIERANISVPNNRNKFVGNTTNVTMLLSSCSGFTMVDEIHLDGVPCTENERDELYQILKKGVIL